MTNHTPTFTSSGATAGFSETSNTTGSTALHALSGTMNFKDSDRNDTHTTSASLKTVAWSGGSTIPTASRNDLNAALTSSILSDSNGNGTIKWSFSAADKDFDFLAKNQTLVLTYEVKVSDNHGGSTTQTVKITITGTDDKPVISMSTVAMVSEQSNHSLSLSPDTAHIALAFTDADLGNTGHTATVTGASASGSTAGLLPGVLGTAELMSFFHVDNVVKAAGSSSGTINTTFAAPDLAFDYLAAGETLNITYTVQLDDHAGGVSTQNVVVTVVGTNDKPAFLIGTDHAFLVEGDHLSPSGDLTAHGDLLFTDLDLSDTHTLSTTVAATRSSGGGVPISNADLLAAMHLTLDDSTGTLLGDVAWNFAIDNDAVNFLSAGETLTLTYTVMLKDSSNATDAETVTITILGTNHPVTITSGPESASIAELDDTTGSPAPDTTSPVPTGTLVFTDQDLSDTHSVQVTLASAEWSGGSSVPAGTLAALPAALSTALTDSTGSGTGGVDWTFSIPDNNLDFLAAGETLTVTYNVTVADGSTNATQTVTVTIAGANDAPVITSGPGSASLAEQPNQTGSSALDTTSPDPTGALTFSDVDLSDSHTIAVSLASAVWSVDPNFLPGDTQNDLMTALATTLHDSAGAGSGGVDWTFSIPDRDLDFLGPSDTLTVTYDVTVSDASGATSTQQVVITITGAEDPLTVNPVTAQVFDTSSPDAGFTGTGGNVIFDVFDSAGDAGVTLSVTEVNGSAANVGDVISGTYGTLLLLSDGSYSYIVNAAVDALAIGEQASEQFTFTVSDNLGRSETTTLTFDITGANEAPTITSAAAAGSVTEDAGPDSVVNGSFESGDLTGWFASGAMVQFLALGGAFGNYSANLSGLGFLQQDIATNPGQHYTLSFVVNGDPEATSTSLSVFWDGALVLGTTDVQLGFTRYTFDVVGDASTSHTSLEFDFGDNGTGMLLDQISVTASPAPATETTGGSISFSDVEATNTHTATFQEDGFGYLGTFSLDPVAESSGSGSVAWHFSVDNADIQFLGQDETLTQTYTVFITDNDGASAVQTVTVGITGTNDAPTAVGETIITDVGLDGIVDVPVWALALNDTDPDHLDHPTPDAITGSSGGTAIPFGDAFFIDDDGTLGGSFDYTVTDGHATSANAATATIINNAAGATALSGTGADEILIGNTGSGEVLDGGGGNDVLIGYGGGYVMTGGSGDDIFSIQSPGDAPNTITDFDNGSSQDRVAILASGFSLTLGQDPGTVFESSDDDQFIFANFHYDNSTQTLYYSPDATTVSAVVVATFQPGVQLHANDLVIV
jgi:VCBS repeat-containing protein